jgi:cytosine/adenosine deaminase-related metal-dependent hydrolase
LTTDDLYVHPCPGLIDAQIRAALDVGLRFDPCRGTIALSQDQGAPFADEIVQDEDTILADTERLITTYHDPSPNAMVRIVCGPTAADTAAPALFRASAELAEKYDVQMTTHLSQHAGEHEWSLQRFGLDPVEWLDDVGWSSPRTWVAHCIFVDAAQIGRLAEWGVGVAHCPTSNSLGAQAIAPIPEMLEQGVRVGLAVDGCGSEHASMWLEARTAVMLARIRRGPTAMGARGALALATTGSAACLGREGQNGVLRPGACGDVVAWPLEGIYFSGAWTDAVEAWLRCGPTAARHTIVAGKVIVEDGRLVLPGLEDMLTRHAEISREWQAVAA